MDVEIGNWGFLHIASDYNRSNMVAELLKYPNINPNIKTKDGWTPFI